MSNIIKVLEIFSNPKNAKNSFCSVSTIENSQLKTIKPCLVDLTTIPCDLCVFYKDNQKAVSTIVKENSLDE